MSFLIFAAVSLVMQIAHGEQLCHPELKSDARSARAIAFLQSIAGYYEGDTCELSIRVCGAYATPEAGPSSRKVGEVLLVDKKTGEDFYLPIDFQSQSTRKTRFEVENGWRMFHYEFIDRNPDPVAGQLAKFYFEAVKEMDLSRLEYVEFGLRRPTDSRIHWAVCQLKPRAPRSE